MNQTIKLTNYEELENEFLSIGFKLNNLRSKLSICLQSNQSYPESQQALYLLLSLNAMLVEIEKYKGNKQDYLDKIRSWDEILKICKHTEILT